MSLVGIGAARRLSALGPDRLVSVDASTSSLLLVCRCWSDSLFAEDGPSGPDWEGFVAHPWWCPM